MFEVSEEKSTFSKSQAVRSDGRLKAYLGDCLEVLQEVPDESVDLLFADPPYNIGKKFGDSIDSWPTEEAYLDWCKSWLQKCLAKLKKSGSLYLMASTQAMPHLDLWLRSRVSVLSRIVWHYDSSGKQARRFFGSLYEPILFCVRDPRSYTFNGDEIAVEARTGSIRRLVDYRREVPREYSHTKIPGNVWYFPRVRYRMPEYEEHPSQKPEVLLERIIRASSNADDLVLDPFAGTFTTCAVAARLGRRAIGIEKEPAFFEIGLRRLQLATHHNGRRLVAPNKSFSRSARVSHTREARGQERDLFDE